MIGRTNSGTGGGGGIDIKPGGAVLCITTLTGSTIKLLKNNVVVKTLKPEQGIEAEDDSSVSTWFYSISSTNYGTWQVQATIGTRNKTSSISITTAGEYEITIIQDLYLIQNGLFNTDYTATRYGGSSLEEDENGYVVLHSAAASSSYATCQFAPDVDVTDYNYIIMDGRARGYYKAGCCPAYGVISSRGSGSSNTTFSAAKVLISATTKTLTERETTYCDISDLTGLVSIGFQEAGSGSSSAQGDIYCYNLWLSTEQP